MKKIIIAVLLFLFLISLIGCTDEVKTSEVNTKALIDSYYEAQESDAFRMFNKSIFMGLADDWTKSLDSNLENPQWNYDSFTYYSIGTLAKPDKTSSSDKNDLYCCTFSTDNDKHGYIVISYEGDGISKVKVAETPYLYDLRGNLEDIKRKLDETDVDIDSAKAVRVQLAGTADEELKEVILITDKEGHQYVYHFS